jgi:transposase
LSARARVFTTGQGRKTDPVDARSVAVVAMRTTGLRRVQADDTRVALRLLVDRRDQFGRTRTDVVNRLHTLLLELIPGGGEEGPVRPAGPRSAGYRPAAGCGRQDPPLAGLGADPRTGPHRQEDQDCQAGTHRAGRYHRQPTAGPARHRPVRRCPAARRRRGFRRFASRAHFASWNGTAPIDASSGDNNRHRLSRAGNRSINRALHIMAIVQLRHETKGRAYYRRRLSEGKPPLEALCALKRRLSDVVYRQMLADAKRLETSPGGHAGATPTSSAADLIPMIDTSDKSLPGPAEPQPKTPFMIST